MYSVLTDRRPMSVVSMICLLFALSLLGGVVSCSSAGNSSSVLTLEQVQEAFDRGDYKQTIVLADSLQKLRTDSISNKRKAMLLRNMADEQISLLAIAHADSLSEAATKTLDELSRQHPTPADTAAYNKAYSDAVNSARKAFLEKTYHEKRIAITRSQRERL